MITHRNLRLIMLAMLLVVIAMVATGNIWLADVGSPFLALAYWVLCTFFILLLIGFAFADMRLLQAKYLRGKSRLLKETMTDEEFTRKLREKKLKIVVEEAGLEEEEEDEGKR